MSVQRLWLCYSMALQKPYCEVCWLFADRSSPNYENHRGWINGVSGSLHNMLDKIKRHEASNMHIQAHIRDGNLARLWIKLMRKKSETMLSSGLKFLTES